MNDNQQSTERDLADWKADAEWRHKWHRRLGRGEAEPEGRFYERIAAALASRAAAPQDEQQMRESVAEYLEILRSGEIAGRTQAVRNRIVTLACILFGVASPPERPTPAASPRECAEGHKAPVPMCGACYVFDWSAPRGEE